MAKKYFGGIIFLSLFCIPAALFAAGGGGGGGGGSTPPPPSCTNDTWTCTEWGSCSLAGEQTRTCTLTNNCPTDESPKPVETQSCTPPCTGDTWNCTDWSSCTLEGNQNRTCTLTNDCSLTSDPKPVEQQSCNPSCTKDTWECGAFGSCVGGTQARTCQKIFDCPIADTPSPESSQSCTVACTEDTYTCADWSQCQEDGRQRRTCTLTNDCKTVKTPAPVTAQVCPGLKCGHLGTLKERIACRVNATPEEMGKEFKILYFPEYCKVEESTAEKKECIALYQSFAGCWQKPKGVARQGCAKQTVGLTDMAAAAATCRALSGTDKKVCVSELKEKIEHLMLFNLYEIEVWAERALEDGKASFSDVVDLELFIEEKKMEVEKNDATSNWKKIVKDAQAAWKTFQTKLK